MPFVMNMLHWRGSAVEADYMDFSKTFDNVCVVG